MHSPALGVYSQVKMGWVVGGVEWERCWYGFFYPMRVGLCGRENFPQIYGLYHCVNQCVHF